MGLALKGGVPARDGWLAGEAPHQRSREMHVQPDLSHRLGWFFYLLNNYLQWLHVYSSCAAGDMARPALGKNRRRVINNTFHFT